VELANGYFQMGAVFVDQGDYTQALTWYGRDREIISGLLAASPDDTTLLQNHALALKRAGGVLVRLGRLPEALQHYQGALRNEEHWAELKQENVKAQMAISFSESDTGLIYWRQKRYADSIQHYRRAAAIRASLHAGIAFGERN